MNAKEWVKYRDKNFKPDILLETKTFEEKGKTRHEITYEIFEHEVSNGKWYRVERFIQATLYHSYKSYRSKEQALKAYNQDLKMEQWRTDGCPK